MIENILYTLSQTSLLGGIVVIFLNALISKNHQRSSFHIASTAVLISILFSAVFYNKRVLPAYFSFSAYTTFSFVIRSLLTLAWLSLSAKWFVCTQSGKSASFCILALLLLFSLSIIIKSTHLGALFIGLSCLAFFQYFLFRFSKESENLYHNGKHYAIIVSLFLLMLGGAVFVLGKDNLSYKAISGAIALHLPLFQMLITLAILCPLFFFMGVAPFHFWLVDTATHHHLPVATYFGLIPLPAMWSVFFKLHTNFFSLQYEHLSSLYFAFGLLSIILGVIGANASRFLRKIFASVTLYQTGVILLILSILKTQLPEVCFVYLELYFFVLLGIYICFYGFKINNEYPNNLNMLKGVKSARPYISAAFVLLVFVLSGLPPMAYFIAQFFMLAEIVKFPMIVYIVLFGLLALLPVYLKIIQTVSFLPREKSFDRVDFGIYVYVLLHLSILMLLMFKPQILMLQRTIFSDMG